MIKPKINIPAKNILLFFPLFMVIACKKTDDGGGGGGSNTTPRIISYAPSAITTGATVTLTGQNFGTNLSQVTVMLGSTTLQATSVNNQTLVFNVPANLLSSGSAVFNLTVIINGVTSNILQVTVTYVFQEPRGWRYINKDMTYGPGIPREIYFYDDAYRFGLAYGNGLLSSTSDDGANWGGIWPLVHWGSAFHVYDSDEAWIETNWKDVWVYDYDYFNASARYARLDTITTIPALSGKAITGVFITKRNRGYILTHDGSVLKINGSFAPSAISLEYQSSNYVNLPLTYDNNNFYAMTGIDSNNLVIAARPKINGVTVPQIILKRNGVYQEYSFTTAQIGYPYRLQYADINNIYFLSLNYELYKLNIATNTWVKLNTPRFNEICFLNGTTGYASTAWSQGNDNYYIYKTTDGGLNWTLDFALDPFHYLYTMCTRNNKVWAVGEGLNTRKNFVIKFNP